MYCILGARGQEEPSKEKGEEPRPSRGGGFPFCGDGKAKFVPGEKRGFSSEKKERSPKRNDRNDMKGEGLFS